MPETSLTDVLRSLQRPAMTVNAQPVIQNADGTISSESTTTRGFDDRFVNLPTILDGRRISEEEAVAVFLAGARGADVPSFPSLTEALAEAERRSATGGAIGNKPLIPSRQHQLNVAQAPFR